MSTCSVSEITSGIQWELERPGVYLVSFGPLKLIKGVRYADASQDRFELYSKTTSIRHPPDREELVNSFSGIKTLPCSSDNTPYQINQYMKLSNRVSGLIWTIILVKISSRLVAAPSLDIRATQAATAYLHLW